MPLVTSAEIKARFPEMAAIEDALVDAILAEADDVVGEHWPEHLRRRAQLYWTAARLQSEGGTARSSTQSFATGAVKAETIGPARIEYETREGGETTSTGPSRANYAAEYEALRAAAFGGTILAV